MTNKKEEKIQQSILWEADVLKAARRVRITESSSTLLQELVTTDYRN